MSVQVARHWKTCFHFSKLTNSSGSDEFRRVQVIYQFRLSTIKDVALFSLFCHLCKNKEEGEWKKVEAPSVLAGSHKEQVAALEPSNKV